jgi:hypothetical protein
MAIRAGRLVVLCLLWIGIADGVSAGPSGPRKFYPDDPLKAEPPPAPVVNPQRRALSELLELVNNTVNRPGERHPNDGVIAAGGVNTLGEVMDSDWFVNRHATRRMTLEELARGPGADHPPAQDGPWRVLTLRPHGTRPGVLIADTRHRVYQLLFDPPDHPEMSTGAQMVSSRFAHAIGYFVPECYLVRFDRATLAVNEESEIVSSAGNRRALTTIDLDVFLRGVARTGTGQYRAVAVYVAPDVWQGYVGPFQWFSRRSDDPNDVVVHEHRRDLRGLFVISAWLNHSTMRAVSTMDVLTDVDGIPRIRHFLVDFFGTLGSGYNGVKQAWEGNGPLVDIGSIVQNAVGFGIWSPPWMRERFPPIPAVGRFAAATFEPERWSPTERLAAFENRLPDDEYWGARQVAAFTDAEIAAIVGTGGYSDPAAAAWITNTLIERRNRIARTGFRKVLPLDHFHVEGGQLRFDDLGAGPGLEDPPVYTARWFRFDNTTGDLTPLDGATSFDLPAGISAAGDGSYVAARIESSRRSPEMFVTVYLRAHAGGWQVVGLERGWPGRNIVDPRDLGRDVSRFDDLTAEQKHLYEPYAKRDAEARGRTMTAAEHFDSQTISARTTFDSVTHALMGSKLTDASGHDLGTSFDLVSGLDRIAGQYHGRRGDEQFRLFAELEPDALEILGKSTEFFRDRDNTVFHVGYPLSFRQTGRVPNIQFSVSEDGRRADIDVDYRASGIPQGLFNGHLSAANSDVRAGDNLERHNRRWEGFVAWWRETFGTVAAGASRSESILDDGHDEDSPPLPPDRPIGARIAEPQDAVAEFLADWLVRRRVDEALDVVSSQTFACVNIDDDREPEAIREREAYRILRETMRHAIDEVGKAHDLTDVIEAPDSISSKPTLVPHAFAREFALVALSPDQAAAQFLVCGADRQSSSSPSYYEALFRFRRNDSAVLGLLWVQEDGRWRLKSFRIFEG